MIVRMTRSLPCLCLLYLVLPTPAAAQDAPASAEAAKVVRVVRVASPPVIDGRLDDDVWQQADVFWPIDNKEQEWRN